MAFTVAGAALDPHNGLATDGLTCDAFNEETWFPSSSPVANTAEPGSPDGTDTSGLLGASGVAGQFLITVPKSGSYWIATYNSWDPTVIHWIKAITHPHTNQQALTVSSDQTSNRAITQTTIAAGSNGLTLPQTTINVASTTGFPSSGALMVFVNTVPSGWTVVQYTGTSGGNQFTGCTGGSGTLLTGRTVSPAYQAGAYRRDIYVAVICSATTAADTAMLQGISTVGGIILPGLIAGIAHAVTGVQGYCVPLYFSVDPNGWYGANPTATGGGTVSIQRWVEVDL